MFSDEMTEAARVRDQEVFAMLAFGVIDGLSLAGFAFEGTTVVKVGCCVVGMVSFVCSISVAVSVALIYAKDVLRREGK